MAILTPRLTLERGLPFELKTPNEETKEAIEDAGAGINTETITLEQLKDELKNSLK